MPLSRHSRRNKLTGIARSVENRTGGYLGKSRLAAGGAAAQHPYPIRASLASARVGKLYTYGIEVNR